MSAIACFRCDADGEIGSGHVVRSVALADELSSDGWTCIFFTHSSTTRWAPALNTSRHDVVWIDQTDETEVEVMASALPEGCDVLVVDHYAWGIDEERSCREWARRLVVIDDLANRRHYCDAIVDTALGRTADEYRTLTNDTCRYFLGPDYALLRSQFARVRYRSLKRRSAGLPAKRLFINFGGSDPNNLTTLALKALERTATDIAADVVVSSSNPKRDELKRLSASHRNPVELHTDVENIADLMAASDLALGAAGGSSWERCCLGLPTVVVCAADNQRDNATALSTSGAISFVGNYDDIDVSALSEALGQYLNRPKKLRQVSQQAAAICDGMGARRLILALAGVERGEPEMPITLEPATADAGELLFDWQKAPTTRQFFRDPRPPTRQAHFGWYERKLAEANCRFHMIVENEKPVGTVRLDRVEDRNDFEISIVVAPDNRNKGIGRAALRAVRKAYPAITLIAHVDPYNTQSQKSFRAAGFIQDTVSRFTLGAQRK